MAALDDEPVADSLTAEGSVDADGTVLIRVAGEIDIATADIVSAVVAKALEGGPAALAFEMSAVDFMDSSGIAVLLESVTRAETVRIRRPSHVVRRVIEATGLSEVLRIED